MAFQTFKTAARLALLGLWLPASGCAEDNNQNLTLRFFKESQGDTCSYSDSSDALTFTTSSIPVVDHCFSFSELFGGNATSGFVNQSSSVASTILSHDRGIYWHLENKDRYDPQTNYSSILYRQHVTDPLHDEYKPGHYADRMATLYAGDGCKPSLPSDTAGNITSWFGFSCWSEDEGVCGTMPYSLNSFYIQEGYGDDSDGTCWLFAKDGAAAGGFRPWNAAASGLVAICVAVWLTM